MSGKTETNPTLKGYGESHVRDWNQLKDLK